MSSAGRPSPDSRWTFIPDPPPGVDEWEWYRLQDACECLKLALGEAGAKTFAGSLSSLPIPIPDAFLAAVAHENPDSRFAPLPAEYLSSEAPSRPDRAYARLSGVRGRLSEKYRGVFDRWWVDTLSRRERQALWWILNQQYAPRYLDSPAPAPVARRSDVCGGSTAAPRSSPGAGTRATSAAAELRRDLLERRGQALDALAADGIAPELLALLSRPKGSSPVAEAASAGIDPEMLALLRRSTGALAMLDMIVFDETGQPILANLTMAALAAMQQGWPGTDPNRPTGQLRSPALMWQFAAATICALAAMQQGWPGTDPNRPTGRPANSGRRR